MKKFGVNEKSKKIIKVEGGVKDLLSDLLWHVLYDSLHPHFFVKFQTLNSLTG